MPVAGGKVHRKHPEPSVLTNNSSNCLTNIVEKIRSYRFAMVLENAQVEDITEKVANVLIAGATPIYYRTHEMFRVSNRHRFISYDIEQPGLALG